MKTKSILCLFSILTVVVALLMLAGDLCDFKARAYQYPTCMACVLNEGHTGWNCSSQEFEGGTECYVSGDGLYCSMVGICKIFS